MITTTTTTTTIIIIIIIIIVIVVIIIVINNIIVLVNNRITSQNLTFYCCNTPFSDKRCSPPTEKPSTTQAVPKEEETVSPPISYVECNNTGPLSKDTDVISKVCNNTVCGKPVAAYSHSSVTSQII